jgi:CheY-like chemotaxis protein
MDEFLTKPVQVAQLLQMVRRFVAKVENPEPVSP